MLVYCVLVDTIERVLQDSWWDEGSEDDIDNYEVKITSTRLDSVYADYDRAVARKDEIDDKLDIEEYAYVREYEVK